MLVRIDFEHVRLDELERTYLQQILKITRLEGTGASTDSENSYTQKNFSTHNVLVLLQSGYNLSCKNMLDLATLGAIAQAIDNLKKKTVIDFDKSRTFRLFYSNKLSELENSELSQNENYTQNIGYVDQWILEELSSPNTFYRLNGVIKALNLNFAKFEEKFDEALRVFLKESEQLNTRYLLELSRT